MRFYRFSYFIILGLALSLLYGCVMPDEEKSMMDEINSLKTSVNEERGASKRIDDLDAETSKMAAETSTLFDKINDDMRSVLGETDRLGHELELLKESDSDLSLAVDESKKMLERIPGLQKKIESVSSKIDSIDKRISTLEIRAKETENKLTLLEKKAALRNKRASKKKLSAKQLYNSALKSLRKKRYREAFNRFKSFIKRYPKHKLADNAGYWIGETYYARGRWDEAVLAFDRVVKKYPHGDKVPASLLKEGISFIRLGSVKEAKLLLQRVVRKYGKTSEAVIAKKKLKEINRVSKKSHKKTNSKKTSSATDR